MRTTTRIMILLGLILLCTQQAGCVQAQQVRFREHLNADVKPSGIDHSLAMVPDH